MGFRKPNKGNSITPSQSLNGTGRVWDLLLVRKDEVPGHPGNGRVLDANWADVETVKKWKHRCISSHGVKCDNPLKVWPTHLASLVDVQKQCIVPGHESVNYVAISYTYGSHSPPVITSTAFKKLQKPFALATPEFSNFVSPIIRHAMFLTSAIDKRYLWADVLCVTHHDPKTASEQVRSMGAIYANAVVTMVATDGDSGSGIRGLKGISDPRDLSQNFIPLEEETLILRNTFAMNEMTFFPTRLQAYYQRGWTCQKYAMAKTKIFFDNDEVHWWSWLGWKGSVYTRTQTGIGVDSNYTCEEEYVEEAFPITEIRPTWFEKREGYKDFTKPPPPGWKRIPATENEPRIYPDGCSKYLFQHESVLERYGRPLQWYYPFPVNEIQESTPPFMPEQTPYLFCETAQATLSGLSTGSGEAILPVGKRSKALRQAWKVYREDLYLVLWVEWKDGVAYRVASGEVIASEWEILDLQKVSLVLG
ncbi:hypothetical protein FPHYL_8111 [Fusarium phyllophilum]|uniref:Heterokaryon incompatibility domain-containing protein n=1 Tax=Fusarium phyllophilum TaxID=47803 RepID=A0A8H5JII1_9HYPO|nr:hypothetical protein FPHYL_8111 [Fusarium phyllophilum]